MRPPFNQPYSFIDVEGGTPTSWSSCREIKVVFDRSIIDAGIEREVRAAIEAVDSASAFRFHVGEVVDHRPTSRWADERFEFSADVIYGVSGPDDNGLLDGDELGITSTHVKTDGDGSRIVAAAVVFNEDRLEDVAPGMGPMSIGAVVTHETLHVLGLDHVRDTSSIMTADIKDGSGFIGPGDIAGLEALAASASCVDGDESG